MNEPQISLILGDLTRLEVDVVVAPASPNLGELAGIAAELHRAAGPGLRRECRNIGHCPVGDSEITSAYGLPSRFVVHAVAPEWRGGNEREAQLLAGCYRSALEWAVDVGATSVAFPALGVVEGGYPSRLAAEVAVRAIREFNEGYSRLTRIVICCHSLRDHDAYVRLLGANAMASGNDSVGTRATETPGFHPLALNPRGDLFPFAAAS